MTYPPEDSDIFIECNLEESLRIISECNLKYNEMTIEENDSMTHGTCGHCCTCKRSGDSIRVLKHNQLLLYLQIVQISTIQ